jgi:hypothetical protein
MVRDKEETLAVMYMSFYYAPLATFYEDDMSLFLHILRPYLDTVVQLLLEADEEVLLVVCSLEEAL